MYNQLIATSYARFERLHDNSNSNLTLERTSVVQGELMDPLWVFVRLQYFEKISP